MYTPASNKLSGFIHIMGDQAHRSHHDGSVWKEITIRRFQAGRNGSSWIRDVHDQPLSRACHIHRRGFLERNLGTLNPDFVALLWGTSTSASTSAPTSGAGAGLTP